MQNYILQPGDTLTEDFYLARQIILRNFSHIPDELGSDHCYVEELIIEEGTVSIGVDVFNGCHSLTNLQLPSTIRIIDSGAFSCNHAISEITIPSECKFIGFEAFAFSGIEKIIFSPGCDVTLDVCVFNSCQELEQVVNWKGINFARPGVMAHCPKLKIPNK